jgi:hypothetical protein
MFQGENDDLKSHSCSKAAHSQINVQSSITEPVAQKNKTLPNKGSFKELITAMTSNKGIGMTEGEWNAIV